MNFASYYNLPIETFDEGDRHRLKIFSDGCSIAELVIQFNIDRNGPWITKLWVHPKVRKQGLAKKLLDHVKKTYNKPIFVKAWPFDDEEVKIDQLIAMYKKAGFEEAHNGLIGYLVYRG